jgi:CRISPR-associated protein Csm1
MSGQILLQGKIQGVEEFLLSRGRAANQPELFLERSEWVALLAEVLPRALLAELNLPRVLLGSGGGAQFLLILPEEARGPADEFLAAAHRHIQELSHGHLRLIWSATENLGDWSVVRKRLGDGMQQRRNTLFDAPPADLFQPFDPAPAPGQAAYFHGERPADLRSVKMVGWSPELPGAVQLGGGKHTWTLSANLSVEGISLARHAARTDDGRAIAPPATLGRRAQGRSLWGVLRGDVDNVGIRLRRAQTIEEHVQLSVMYKQFFANELELLCSMPEFFRKVTILYSGGDDFAVYGAWDALIPLAREMQRLFQAFAAENLKEYPGAEGKTIAMALALAPDAHASLASVFEECGRNLEIAQTSDKDCMYLFGRILEWKQLGGAAEIKETVSRLLADFRSSRRYLGGLRRFYQRESSGADRSASNAWRFERRFNRILSGARQREFQKLRAHLIQEMMSRKSTEVKLRPAGLVALEWARLGAE